MTGITNVRMVVMIIVVGRIRAMIVGPIRTRVRVAQPGGQHTTGEHEGRERQGQELFEGYAQESRLGLEQDHPRTLRYRRPSEMVKQRPGRD